MEPASFRPRLQVFVCVNARAAGDPLQSACGTHGPAVYAALKRSVQAAGLVSDVWITRAACLGHCPPRGCAVAVYPEQQQLVNVTAEDVPALSKRVLEPRR